MEYQNIFWMKEGADNYLKLIIASAMTELGYDHLREDNFRGYRFGVNQHFLIRTFEETERRLAEVRNWTPEEAQEAGRADWLARYDKVLTSIAKYDNAIALCKERIEMTLEHFKDRESMPANGVAGFKVGKLSISVTKQLAIHADHLTSLRDKEEKKLPIKLVGEDFKAKTIEQLEHRLELNRELYIEALASVKRREAQWAEVIDLASHFMGIETLQTLRGQALTKTAAICL